VIATRSTAIFRGGAGGEGGASAGGVWRIAECEQIDLPLTIAHGREVESIELHRGERHRTLERQSLLDRDGESGHLEHGCRRFAMAHG